MLGFLKSKPKEEGGWAERLKLGLKRTREILNTDLTELFSRHPQIDEALYEEQRRYLLAPMLVSATGTSSRPCEPAPRRIVWPARVGALRSAVLLDLISPPGTDVLTAAKPFVIMMVGVNGTGKMTSGVSSPSIFRRTDWCCAAGAPDAAVSSWRLGRAQ
jgi:fused signal recognition particle receptor